MSIADCHPDKNTERVDGHKCAFAAARIISRGAGFEENTTPYFTRSDAIMLSKYKRHDAHQILILRIVLISQTISSVSPAMTFSTVSASYRLYGTTISGSS